MSPVLFLSVIIIFKTKINCNHFTFFFFLILKANIFNSYLRKRAAHFLIIKQLYKEPKREIFIGAQKNPSITKLTFINLYIQFGRLSSFMHSGMTANSSLSTPPQLALRRCLRPAEKWRHLVVLRPPVQLQLSLWRIPSSQAVAV